LPHALQSAVHVAAPQHDAATDHIVVMLGIASSGRDSRAPILAAVCYADGKKRRTTTVLSSYVTSTALSQSASAGAAKHGRFGKSE